MIRIAQPAAFAAFVALVSLPAAVQARPAARSADPVPENSAPAMSARDLVTMPRLGPVVVAHDRYAVYTVTETDPETLARAPAHHMLDLADAKASPVRLELGLRANSLAFGSDGLLYFLSSQHLEEGQDNRSRLWRAHIGTDGSVAVPTLVADVPGTDIAGFKLSPAGDKVALWAEIARDCPKFGCDTGSDTGGSGRLYDSEIGFYRHWDRWIEPGIFNRAFVFEIEDGRITGEGVPIDGADPAKGLVGNVPTMPFGGGEDLAWAPDGSGLYFAAREAGSDEPGSTDLDIYFSDLNGSAPTVLTGPNKATDTLPTPSPDGRWLAYLAMARPGYESDRMVVHLRDVRTGKTRALTRDTDLSFGSLAWSEDGSYLLATATDVLDTPIFTIDPKTGAVRELDLIAGNEAHLANLVPLKRGRLLFTRDSIGVPSELFLSSRLGRARPLTDVATRKMGEFASIVTTRFSFAGAEGDTVWGQITRLEEQDGPIPAILYIHGGPQGSFIDGWSSRWNPRVLASQGYAVISVDFHGSAGYGQDFMDSINRDWGGKPLEDLQKGLAAALALDSQIDGSRACAMGASYGGYMVNWIAGNWPDRFSCLVQHDGLFDLRSFYYSTEELWFPRWDFGGSYEENKATYERWNPVNHVANWRTPMLVVAGERDFRVPYTQGLQSFTALQERGIPSQLLVFPDENHWVLGAKNSLQWHETVFAWLDRWLKKDRLEGSAE